MLGRLLGDGPWALRRPLAAVHPAHQTIEHQVPGRPKPTAHSIGATESLPGCGQPFMLLSDFDFDLPADRIAQTPTPDP